MKFLIVEDNPHNTVYAQYLLKKLGHENIAAVSGEEALELLKNQRVDCMLVDINLGEGISGVEFCQEVKKQKKHCHTPTIAVTAYSTIRDKEKFIDAGFDDFIAKPYSFDDLKLALERNMVLEMAE